MKLLDTVVLNDVARRLRLRDLALLQRLITYLFSTAGNLFSTNKVVGALARTESAITDAFPKCVITLDRYGLGTTSDGIKALGAIDRLLER